ncbi:OPI1 [Candida theae]|uniref:OPI1 n=1 Tax=Candida theae TaxID=1198502 RepID=A0AAD5BHT0_9ASCO|nr:OPI1 [Candida theae]KAI5963376.1 OPI1 [Candida theae]
MAPGSTNTPPTTHTDSSSDTDTNMTELPPPPPYSKEPTTHSGSDSVSPTQRTGSSPFSIHHMLNSENLQHQQQQHQQSLPLPDIPPESRDLSAAHALTQLTGSATPPSDADTMVTTDQEDDLDTNESQRQQRHPLVSTVSMVAKHPIVMNAVKYYETSKRRYSSFNYAAGIVEAAAIPVVTRIEDNLNTRHQTSRHASSSSSSSSMSPGNTPPPTLNHHTMSSFDNKQKKRRLSTSSTMSTRSTATTATTALSGIVPSSDAKKRLQFCIHILKAANATINSKINFLQLKLDETELAIKEKRHQLQTQRSNDSLLSDQTTEKTKGEIVGTVKKIIHLISNFRPSTLTTTTAPTTQANAATETALASGTPATPTTPASYHPNTLSRTSSYNGTPVPSGSTDNANTPTSTLTPTTSHGSCLQEFELKNTIRDIILRLPASIQNCETSEGGNDRIFVFAKESLEMITKLTNVFSDQLAHVESWVNGEIPEDPKAASTEEEVQEKTKHDVHMKDESGFDSVSTRCSSEEPDGITSATKRMRIDELIEN